jgi:hypothetical protein
MITPEEVLVKNRVFLTTDIKKHFNLDVTRDCYVGTQRDIVKSMNEYAKHVLEITAEKAEIKNVKIPNGLSIRTCVVDKDSILNCLEK